MTTDNKSFETFTFSGMALDPIHIGTGGSRLGRVDNTIVRDPVTRIPKIPGSSLAGVMRAYTAMAKGKYPNCAGIGQPEHGGAGGHCGKSDCPVCTVFGFARRTDSGGGFAGLAAFSDMHVLLFPVATQEGPCWVTSPSVMRIAGEDLSGLNEDVVYRKTESRFPLNLGWLLLSVGEYAGWDDLIQALKDLQIPESIQKQTLLVSDKLFSYVVNSNLEVRTSVAIDPATGAAEDKALFTYEALPRATVLVWEVTCKNPKHFKIGGEEIKAVDSPDKVHELVRNGYDYLEHLGIGGMGSRGMGRLRVMNHISSPGTKEREKENS